ncbi:YegP family protein [Arthrobacter sp. NamB2]|uniref:YegP family protein n=1 Tax=Arthrobacter sp. NamB2 TaxID=2576035 RepID=UPI00167BC096|nr:YegP family protein [Arthrobacter sp. NamB2]
MTHLQSAGAQRFSTKEDRVAGRFELYRKEEHFRFRLTGDDGATLVTSEPYDDKDTAVAGINGIRDCAASALIADLS